MINGPIIIGGANSLILLLFCERLFSLYKEKSKKYYLFWSIGLLFFSLSTLFYLLHENWVIYGSLFDFVSTIFSLLSFSTIIIGIGYFVKKIKMFIILASIAPILTVIMTFFSFSTSLIDNLISLFYLILTIIIFWIRKKQDLDLYVVDIGWVIILVANIGYVMGQMTLTMTYAFSLIGKIIVYQWMSKPRFVSLTSEIESFLLKGEPATMNNNQGVSIVEFTPGNKDKFQWILQNICNKDNIDTKKILLFTSELNNNEELEKTGLLDVPNLYILQMSPKYHSAKPIFSEKNTLISDDLNQVNIMINEIFSLVDEKSIKTILIIDNLSTLVHIHGIRRVYSFIISMIPLIKKTHIETYFLISPSTHENKYEIIQIRQLGDQLIEIS